MTEPTDRPTDPPTGDAGHEPVPQHPAIDAPPPPAGVLDAARASALTAFDEIYGAAAVRSIDSAPSRRWYERVPLGAVAAALLVVALVGALTQLDLATDGDDTASTPVAGDRAEEAPSDESGTNRGESYSADAAEGDDGGADSAAVPGAADAATGGATSGSGGMAAPIVRYPDVDALVEALANRQPGEPAATTDADRGDGGQDQVDSECAAIEAAGVDTAAVIEVVDAVVDGVPVEAVVYDSDTGERRVAVVAVESCEVIADRSLERDR